MIVSQMKQLNDHKVTFRVDLEPGEEVHAFLSSYGQKTAQAMQKMVGETLFVSECGWLRLDLMRTAATNSLCFSIKNLAEDITKSPGHF